MSTSTANLSLTTLLTRFRQARAATLAFTAPLSPEDMMVQSCADASPIKWHLAHTSWFFETFVLTPFAPAYKPFHPDFHWLFNSYYNSLGEMPAKNLRSSFSRPPLDDILAFRAHVDRAIAALLDDDLGENEDEVLRRVALGIEHEQQHLELAAYDIKHALFTNPLHPAYRTSGVPPQTASSFEVGFTEFQGGLIEIGITPEPSDPLAFAFDNETPRHQVFLQPFQLANRLVTVREYLAFIDDNGYTRPELWLSEGWTTCRAENWQAPLYWARAQNRVPHPREARVGLSVWNIYTLAGFRSLDELADTPVCHLSFFEADAFARWSGCRLPTEFEWEHAAAALPDSAGANFLESGDLHPTPSLSSSSLSTLSSRSEAKGSTSPQGMQQLFGDVWEWTASPYTGYPGYKPLPGALGEYNGKFMSSQIILRGGSCVTPATHIRATYRNFFSPATRWHFCGLRLAK
jgi:ergothioneine biosynthesis protein EgtB